MIDAELRLIYFKIIIIMDDLQTKNQILLFAVELFFNDTDDEEESLHKVSDYVELIVPNYTDKQFQSHFRMSPCTFENVLQKIHLTIDKPNRGGNPEISIEKQCMITIWYLANLESFRGVADRFGVSISTAWNSVGKICKILLKINSIYKIISLPNEGESMQIINGFKNRTGFPGIVGAIDGSHIPIKAPKENSASYVNRKKFHSVLLQGVCNNKHRFIDCYVGEAGSIHDACLYRRSGLELKLDNWQMQENRHLLGDSAYPLSMKILVPYRDNGYLTDIQKYYNAMHSKNRVVIEQTFAYLKGRFRRLKLLECVRMDLVCLLIMSACILHNICQSENDILPNLNIEEELNEERLMHPDNVNILLHENNNGINKRNNIANLLYVNRIL